MNEPVKLSWTSPQTWAWPGGGVAVQWSSFGGYYAHSEPSDTTPSRILQGKYETPAEAAAAIGARLP